MSDFTDSELNDKPSEPLTTAELALASVVAAVLAGALGAWLYFTVRYIAPLLWG